MVYYVGNRIRALEGGQLFFRGLGTAAKRLHDATRGRPDPGEVVRQQDRTKEYQEGDAARGRQALPLYEFVRVRQKT